MSIAADGITITAIALEDGKEQTTKTKGLVGST